MGMSGPQVVATTSTFILAMVLFPEVQVKAQEEIARVVGPRRIPNLNDREHLPYLSALYKELLRWHVIGPMGISPSSKHAAFLHACLFRNSSFDDSRRLVRGLFHSQRLVGHEQSLASPRLVLVWYALQLTRNAKTSKADRE